MDKKELKDSLEVIVLAAGLGTRMKSPLPKVVHKIADTPILELLLRTTDQALSTFQEVYFNIVIGHGRNHVTELVHALQSQNKINVPIQFTVQEEQLGTGHALRLALEHSKAQNSKQPVLVLNGDLPLLTAKELSDFIEAHKKEKSVASLGSMILESPAQYGRIIRKGRKFVSVVEAKDASRAQLQIKEVNGGIYVFQRDILKDAIYKVSNKNAAGEFYLPDIFSYATKKKKKIYAHVFGDVSTLSGVNNMEELAAAQSLLFRRMCQKWMREGVFIAEPNHTYIGPYVELNQGCSVGPLTSILGESKIAEGVKIGAFCDLRDVEIGKNTVLKNNTVAEKTQIGQECSIGPMVHLRAGSNLSDRVRVGNFVEIKESTIASNTSAAHLSYIGDATIGSNVNLGCGFITCNFDGRIIDGKRKHRTKIGNHVFVGSDSQVIAPIEIADGTFIASGSTVSESVKEKDSLVIARSKQVTKPGYAKKYKSQK
ncbi:MAG: bifunctional UDP-N-acetylglucosamine diphosphorylase/glucosamine-1-phosphate N-acetyltransferase GlmU [Bacteriovoracia bacterium]